MSDMGRFAVLMFMMFFGFRVFSDRERVCVRVHTCRRVRVCVCLRMACMRGHFQGASVSSHCVRH